MESIEGLSNQVMGFSRWIPVDPENKLDNFFRQMNLLDLLVVLGEYAEATAWLIETNINYPELGNYSRLQTNPLFDRIKAEYPPFAEAVANLKLPPPLVVENGLERLKY